MAALRELQHVDETAAQQVLRMSASTLERLLRARAAVRRQRSSR